MIYQILFKRDFYAEARHNLKLQNINIMPIKSAKLWKQLDLHSCWPSTSM